MERKEHSGVHFLVQWCSYPLVVFDSSAPLICLPRRILSRTSLNDGSLVLFV